MTVKKKKQPRTKKVQGFNILENECIWMKSGVINFKICDQAYDCIHCPFDKAMTQALGKGKGLAVKKEQQSWRDRMRRRHADQRECRHMLSGRVAYKICSHDFRCDTCEFDQSLDEVELSSHLAEPAMHRVLGYKVADNYYYHRGHAWARVEYAGRVRLGLDDFALRLLGPVDEYRLPSLGQKVFQTDSCLSLARESNEAEVLSPVSGTVVAVNHEVLRRPTLTNTRPYSDGWLMVIEPERLKGNLKNLFFGEETDNWLESDVSRLHDIVMAEHGPIAATGGEPIDDVFGNAPEIGWKKLVSEFLLT
ncbi:MAG: glycine cleavage system protein H [Deltaproteobacteria bacterium]|nr:glycine cleavage system protein H [Deltaproteobacteria bacterium]MBW2069849.1 glycine cleavage system protein H [Deltaproteobacteria bacterium]